MSHSINLPLSDALYKPSVSVLFVIAILSVVARLAIRLRHQKRLSWDDGFVFVGAACLICAFAILFVFLDGLYLAEAFTERPSSPDFRGVRNPILAIQDFHKFSTVCLILLWTGICCVKFSFLFLFRKLVDRIRWLTVYWWIITGLNLATWLYGVASQVIGCPYYYNPAEC